MNRDVKILRGLAYHLSALPRPGVISISDNDRLAMALLKTADELHEEDVKQVQEARAAEDAYSEACALDSPFNPDNSEAPSPVGDEARRLRMALEEQLKLYEDAYYLNRAHVVSAFNRVPNKESQDYVKQQGGSHEAHCLRTGISRLLQENETQFLHKWDLIYLFEQISPRDSNFIPYRGYTSDRYRR